MHLVSGCHVPLPLLAIVIIEERTHCGNLLKHCLKGAVFSDPDSECVQLEIVPISTSPALNPGLRSQSLNEYVWLEIHPRSAAEHIDVSEDV